MRINHTRSIIPPNARQAVFAITHTMVGGIHFFHFDQYDRSVCGWISSRFATSKISNAEHFNFLSLLQAFSTLWVSGFDSTVQPSKLSEWYTILPAVQSTDLNLSRAHPSRLDHDRGAPNFCCARDCDHVQLDTLCARQTAHKRLLRDR